MQTLETISAKMLNQLKKTDPKIYNDLLNGKSINIQNSAVKPLANTGHQAGKLGGTTSGTSAGTIITQSVQKKSWADFSLAQLKKLQTLDPVFFDRLFEAERERIRQKHKI